MSCCLAPGCRGPWILPLGGTGCLFGSAFHLRLRLSAGLVGEGGGGGEARAREGDGPGHSTPSGRVFKVDLQFTKHNKQGLPPAAHGQQQHQGPKAVRVVGEW